MKIISPSKFGVIFLFLTLVPAIILSYLAIGSLDKEVAYLEKQGRLALQDEIYTVHQQANDLLKDLHRRLAQALTNPETLQGLKNNSDLLTKDFPFAKHWYVISSSREFIYPAKEQAAGAFVSLTESFFKGSGRIPTYAGSYPATSNISPAEPVESERISFEEIIRNGDSGTIPLMDNGVLHLIFWQKINAGGIAGCEIDVPWLKEELVKRLPALETNQRILTILNEQAKPLAAPPGQTSRDWRQTYMSKEISRVLPNWKIAVYLNNTDDLSSQGYRLSKVSRLLTFAMVLVIAFGGILIVRSLMDKIEVAQQKAAFATNVSHELRTPLTSIRMFTEIMLGKKEVTPEKKEQYLRLILSETQRLTGLINNVLDFSALGKKNYRYNMTDVDLVELCEEVCTTQQPRLEMLGFTVKLHCAVDAVFIHGDREALKQPLINLLSNAEKYSGTVKEINVSIIKEAKTAVIEIADKGIGIPNDLAEKVFEEYYRVDNRLDSGKQGTGLGLSIARSIIRDHKGDLTCHPQKQGVMFRITLPVKES